jgi:hypothetical protein
MRRHHPIHPGEVPGYRVWHILGNRLGSITASYTWRRGTKGPADVDDGGGFYAFKHIDAAREMIEMAGRGRVAVGKIAMWGEIVEHEWGYRAQFAKVTELIIPARTRIPPSQQTKAQQEVWARYMAAWERETARLKQYYGLE